MYYPYLRGKQYELLALRELFHHKLIGKYVIPVVEPVRFNSAFVTFLEKTSSTVMLIVNPQVGTFSFDYEKISDEKLKQRMAKALKNSNVSFGLSIPSSTNKQILPWWPSDISISDFCYIQNEQCLDNWPKFSNYKFKTYIVFDSRSLIRRIPAESYTILFRDCFVKQKKNMEYANTNDELFSDEHLFFFQDSFHGYSDASVIGLDYSDSGFSPSAIAIHLVYFDSDKVLRVHHFVSESKDSSEDLASMFKSACRDIPKFVEEKNVFKTNGLNQLLMKISEGAFPGLGSIKKYSIMHHLELMEGYFEGIHKDRTN